MIQIGNVGEVQIPFGTKFHPCLAYSEGLGVLQVILRDCSTTEVEASRYFDLLKDNHSGRKSGTFVGFNLWGVHEVLGARGYTKSSISLEDLIKRFEKYKWLPLGQPVFGGHLEQVLRIARKHQFVWHIPK